MSLVKKDKASNLQVLLIAATDMLYQTKENTATLEKFQNLLQIKIPVFTPCHLSECIVESFIDGLFLFFSSDAFYSYTNIHLT